MRYKVARNLNLFALVREVEDGIAKGWEPFGGVAIDADECYCQAMINRKLRSPGEPQGGDQEGVGC